MAFTTTRIPHEMDAHNTRRYYPVIVHNNVTIRNDNDGCGGCLGVIGAVVLGFCFFSMILSCAGV